MRRVRGAIANELDGTSLAAALNDSAAKELLAS
jgi:hypothetical protein